MLALIFIWEVIIDRRRRRGSQIAPDVYAERACK